MHTCYIAGKLSDNAVGYIKNVHRMIVWAREVRKLGMAVYVPALDLLEGLVDGNFNYDDYFNNSREFLLMCDCVFVCPEGFETSEGTKREIQLAKDAGIPVFYDTEKLNEFNKGL